MSNPSKSKGTAFESAVVNWFHDNGHPHVERRALHGNTDRGDLNVPGSHSVFELKNCKTLTLGPWADETEDERIHAAATYGILIVKRARTTDIGRSHCIVPLWQLRELYVRAGLLPQPEAT